MFCVHASHNHDLQTGHDIYMIKKKLQTKKQKSQTLH